MSKAVSQKGRVGLDQHGIHNVDNVFWTLPTPALYSWIVRRREGLVAHLGPIVVRTGHHTGRSPNDKFIVREPSIEDEIWWGDENRPFEEGKFEALRARLLAYLQGNDLFVQDCYVCTDPEHRINLRVITQTAWHSLFARNMFRRAPLDELPGFVPDFTVISAPHFHASPSIDGTNSEAFIIVNYAERLVIIGGTSYGGEIKKSVFSVLNALLPSKGVFPMHCGANVGSSGDVALYFGLSGTGKTTLSSDPQRALIGDDEHGWSNSGVFNFESGCYAKVIRLSKEAEPQIWGATRRFGTILENVAIDSNTRRVNLDDDALTENTRASYPINYISGAVRSGMAGHPKNVFMLTADAFGVMPPIARLTPEQGTYHFLAGYTAKLAGTERELGKEPVATFSTCFAAPFMVLDPTVYARMLREKANQHKVNLWLVNTGWTGGPYGVGHRMEIAYTRAMIRAALDGALEDIPTEPDPIFGVHVPVACPNVPPEVLKPRNTWEYPEAYDQQAAKLSGLFHGCFDQFAGRVAPKIRAASPRRV